MEAVPAPALEEEAPPAKAMTIGALCKALEVEFPDISISKIRYLEDQKLLSPRRTPGGYRLYSAGDVARLRTILRLQRDEFLPLRVIRQELASGRTRVRRRGAERRPRRRRGAPQAPPERHRAERRRAVLARRRRRGDPRRPAPRRRARGLRRHQGREPRRRRSTTTRPSARSSAPSPSSPATASAGATCARSGRRPTARRRCCSRSSPRRCARATTKRREEAIEALENLAAVTTHLKHLLLIRDLRKIVG